MTASLRKHEAEASRLRGGIEKARQQGIDLVAKAQDPKIADKAISDLEDALTKAEKWIQRLNAVIPGARIKVQEARAKATDALYQHLRTVREHYEGELRSVADAFVDVIGGWVEALKRVQGELGLPIAFDLIERSHSPKLCDHEDLARYMRDWSHLLNRSLVRPRAKTEEGQV